MLAIRSHGVGRGSKGTVIGHHLALVGFTRSVMGEFVLEDRPSVGYEGSHDVCAIILAS